MVRSPARPECFINSERERMSEIIRKHPNGILFYNCNSGEMAKLQSILTRSLAARQVVVSDSVFHYTAPDGEVQRIFPADMGTLIGNNFFAYPQINQLLETIAQSFQVDPEILKEYLPEIVEQDNESYEGGLNIEVAGSPLVYSVNPLFESYKKQGVCYLFGLHHAIELLRRQPATAFGSQKFLFKGHVDLSASACQSAEGIRFYIYDWLLDFLESWRNYGLIDRELQSAVEVPEKYVLSGGLNLKFIDGKVLAPSREAIFPDFRTELERLGMEIVDLGEDQFNLLLSNGPKCRSLNLQWIKK